MTMETTEIEFADKTLSIGQDAATPKPRTPAAAIAPPPPASIPVVQPTHPDAIRGEDGVLDVPDETIARARAHREERAAALTEAVEAEAKALTETEAARAKFSETEATKDEKAWAAARDVLAGKQAIVEGRRRKHDAACAEFQALVDVRTFAEKTRATRRVRDFRAEIEPELAELRELRLQVFAVHGRLAAKVERQRRDAVTAGITHEAVDLAGIYDLVRRMHVNVRLGSPGSIEEPPMPAHGLADGDVLHHLLNANVRGAGLHPPV